MDMALIKELRERTGVGFGDCKKALVEADWDMDRAVDIVRLQSGAKAAKKADRTAAEGLLGLKVDGDRAAMVEVNVETDFAARNPKFAAFVERAVTTALEDGADGLAEALEGERQALVQEIGENINVRRATRLDAEPGGTVVGYLHMDRKSGTVVVLDGGRDDAVDLGQDIAMHVTAMRPLVVSPEDVPPEVVAKERAIYEEQAAEEVAAKQSQSKKPLAPEVVERIATGIVTGRVRKFLAESSLLEQDLVTRLPAKVKIGKLLKDLDATCEGFARFEVGEGIDRKDEDFAAEVRKQLG
ncbi:MAG: translation elongation factor Ts [Gammaproteobacteria bacterium]|nr:translation elongation factor Ts [Gammaproteobacteria bacterium]